MKVCIPKSDVKVTRHFGKAPEFAFFIIEDTRIVSTETVQNPGREKVAVPLFVVEHEVTHVIASGIGARAVGILREHNVDVFEGAVGYVDTVLERFLKGELKHHKITCADEHVCTGGK